MMIKEFFKEGYDNTISLLCFTLNDLPIPRLPLCCIRRRTNARPVSLAFHNPVWYYITRYGLHCF